jgi:RHS repeat-associated protein
VDAHGRRVRKFDSSGPASTIIFFYDPAGHLLGEYDANGKALREYVWLGNTPLAMFTPNPSSSVPLVYFVHADHLDAPRALVDSANRLRWSWFADAFGSTLANSNPGGVGAVTLPLRFPGQYFDPESGLHYNAMRDYDAAVGRYTQSDPIGLAGGINTYAYADGSPTTKTDPLGLATYMCTKPLHALGGDGARSGPDIWGNPLYHQYLCINDGKGGYTCGGQDQRGQKWYDPISGPGKPSNDKYDPQTCEQKEPDNNCIEQCLLKKFAGPRPRYGIPFGTDCQEWSDDALKDCQKQCKKK